MESVSFTSSLRTNGNPSLSRPKLKLSNTCLQIYPINSLKLIQGNLPENFKFISAILQIILSTAVEIIHLLGKITTGL